MAALTTDLVSVRRALLSVSDKTGLTEFARALHEHGVELYSTGGSANTLREAGLPVRSVEDVTGSPEMLGGRVKTLHPKIHGGILARRDTDTATLELHGIEPIDLVCINLYPFEQTVAKPGVGLDEAIEQIDIGGPSMIRSAAKNAQWVVCVTDPGQYRSVIHELAANGGATALSTRRELARSAFARTSQYDAAIARYLYSTAAIKSDSPFPDSLDLGLSKACDLRYGENPHQPAAVYRASNDRGPSLIDARQLHGKPMSYNNMLDASAAMRLAIDLHRQEPGRTAAVVVKHTNPCGAAIAPTTASALRHALDGDPLAAFGGIVALSQTVDSACAQMLTKAGTFLEVIIAPDFSEDALRSLRERFANIRLLAIGAASQDLRGEQDQPTIEVRTIPGGALVQHADSCRADPASWNLAAGPSPSEADLRAGAFMDAVARSLTSNAVALGRVCEDGAVELVGAGAGQMDRVASCRIAIEKAGSRASDAIAASDAFFPFPDGPTLLIDAGVRMIIHPGGSKRDGETFDLCALRGVACLTTGIRRFRH